MILIPVGMMSAAAGGGGGGGFSGALDSYATGLWFTGGIKRLLTSYTGSLLRVRRSSDSTEMDVGYNAADGTLDTVSMLAWGGASSLYVTKIYDQSGNGNNFQQTTAASQPRIANAGTYDGYIRLDGTDDFFVSLNTSPSVAALSIAGRYTLRAASTGSNSQSIITHGNAGAGGHNVMLYQEQGVNGRYNTYSFEAGTSLNNAFATTVTSEVSDLVAYDKTASGAAKIVAFRGGGSQTQATTTGSQTTANFTAETMYIGAYSGTSQFAQMNGKHFAVWTNSQSANGAAITSAL